MDELLNSNYTVVIATLSRSLQRLLLNSARMSARARTWRPRPPLHRHYSRYTHTRECTPIVEAEKSQRGYINLVIKNQHAC